MVPTSTTVGTPIAVTGKPSVLALISLRALPTPEPGVMPVSVTCMVRQSRSSERAASASMTMTCAGRSSAHTQRI